MSPLAMFLARRRDVIKLTTKVAGGVLGMFLCMWLAAAYFADTYAANLCLFTLYSICFECLCSLPHTCLWRRLLYVLCVVAVFLCGLALFIQATNCHGVTP